MLLQYDPAERDSPFVEMELELDADSRASIKAGPLAAGLDMEPAPL